MHASEIAHFRNLHMTKNVYFRRWSLLGCCAAQTGRSLLFQRCLLSLSSGWRWRQQAPLKHQQTASYQATRRNKPGDGHLQARHRVNLVLRFGVCVFVTCLQSHSSLEMLFTYWRRKHTFEKVPKYNIREERVKRPLTEWKAGIRFLAEAFS
jgi:hypothetical protein